MTLAGEAIGTRDRTAGIPNWLAVWLVLTVAICSLWWAGFRPNADADDILKLHEIRHLLISGSIFDRTIPGVLQPEPMVSHWPWIADAPYALAALLFGLVLPFEAALHAAKLVVPPLLLLPLVWLLNRIVLELGFDHAGRVLGLCAAAALLSATEFQPGRIDYHNLQMILLAAIVWLSMRATVRAAAMAGGMVGLSLSLSAELAGFMLLAAAIPAVRFIIDKPGAKQELPAFGGGLVFAACVLLRDDHAANGLWRGRM